MYASNFVSRQIFDRKHDERSDLRHDTVMQRLENRNDERQRLSASGRRRHANVVGTEKSRIEVKRFFFQAEGEARNFIGVRFRFRYPSDRCDR